MNDSEFLQLTVQSMCLEKMLLCEINIGYIFYNKIKHRVEVLLTVDDKNTVRSIVTEMYDYYKFKHMFEVKTRIVLEKLFPSKYLFTKINE
ncbi:hypothetical protein IC3_04632 [Bacillus cereus VD142]|nr:hypothetical protein IC3_04632 [Bacillus cereus VD142]